MQKFLNASLLLALGSPAFSGAVITKPAQDWPGWLGASQGAVAKGTPPTQWGEDSNVSWKVPVPGRGLSSPVVVDNIIYLTTAVPTQAPEEKPKSEPKPEEEAQSDRDRSNPGRRRRMPKIKASEHEFRLLALELETGKLLWSKLAATLTPHEGTHADGSFATPTVAVFGDRIIASFGSFGIFAYTKAGELAWSVDLGDQSVRGNFGEGSSPVIAGGNALILWGHNGESFLVALDLGTGEEAWRQPRERITNWSSPTVVKVGDQEQVIVVGTSTQAYDAKSGELIWFLGGDGKPSPEPEPTSSGRAGPRGGPIATPLVVDGRLFTTFGGTRGSIISVDVDSKAEDKGLDSKRLLWKHDRDTPGIPSPLVIDETLYVVKSGGGQLSAFDVVTGETRYTRQRLEAVTNVYASPVATGNHIYLTGRDGTFEVVRAGQEFESVAVNTLDDTFDATPAIVGGRLLLRGSQFLYCIAAPSK